MASPLTRTAIFVYSTWLMTSRNALQNACSLLDSAHPSTYVLRSAGVEFNRLVSSDLQILDPRGRASFLGLSSSKTETPPPNRVVCVVSSPWSTQRVVHWEVTEFCFPAADRKTEGRAHFLFPHNPLLSSLSQQTHARTLSLRLVCWPCGLFSERFGLKQHIF